MEMHDIEEEIERLEQADTTYANCEKLATLYIVREYQRPKMKAYSSASSEFLLAISGAPTIEALQIIDEHFEAIRLIYPKEYDAVIAKIKALK